MTNEEYLKGMKKADEEWFNDSDMSFKQLADDDTFDDYRRIRALEIIAEELCKLNSPTVRVEMIKPKIKIHKETLNQCMKKTSI